MNIKNAIKKVVKGGGKMEMEPMMIPNVGLYATFLDTEGNRVSMLQPVASKKPAKAAKKK